MPLIATAAVLYKTNEPLVVQAIDVPNLLAGQVLVKVLYSGVCGSQLMEVKGGRGEDKWLPHLLGHEGSGVVLEVGQGVTKVAPGDEVILGWIKGTGITAPGAKYKSENENINSGRITTLSNYTIVSESCVYKKPSELAFDAAILFGCALPTGAGMVLNELKPKKKQSVVVVGLGGIGLSALMALKSIGISNIIAVDIHSDKLDLAKRLGAHYVFNSNKKYFEEEIRQLTQGGTDFCIESGGQVETIELGFSLIHPSHGMLLFASHPSNEKRISIAPHELISGKKIQGSWGGGTLSDDGIIKLHKLFSSTKAPLEMLLTKRYKLEQINDALHDLELGAVFRPIIEMEHHNEVGTK